MGELIEENGLEKKEITFRDFLDGLEHVSAEQKEVKKK